MSRKKRTVKELREASEHLYYEFVMLTSLARGIWSGIAGTGSIANAMLESFVVHVRTLLDFLYSENPRPDDVIAEDYFNNPNEWRQLRPTLSELLTEVKGRVGKEVAHLTYARLDVTPETKTWHFLEIANDIDAVMKIFLQHVSQSNLSKQWSSTNIEG